MTPPTPTVVAGIDVGKRTLDAHILDGRLDRQFDNTKPGRRALRNWLLKHSVTRAVFEPTGRFHRNLHQCLFEAGLETILVNPLRSRRFAEAIGQLAKNDRVDASMLARYGLLKDLDCTPPKPHKLRLLSDLLALRRKLVEQLGALRKLRAELDPDAAPACDPAVNAIASAIADLDARMQACIASDPTLARRAAIIRSIPGFGPVNAACLCADMPELGSLDRRQAAALFGLAPFDNDSGQNSAGRHIRGGRALPRNLLYMAATSAIRCDPATQACYQRLCLQGKDHKVAVVAIMRKLVALLTALLRDNRFWQLEPPALEIVV